MKKHLKSEHQVIEINLAEPWRSNALCQSNTLKIDFFSEDKNQIKLSKSICNKCIVAHECLEFAVRNEEKHGIWGGFTFRERNKALRSTINLTKEEAKVLVIKYGNEILS